MEINVNVAKGYVQNSRSRRIQCEEWSEWLGLMPIGKPLTATEVVQLVEEKYGRYSWHTPSVQAVSAMLKAVKGTGAVVRMEIAIEPYEIEVETRRHWSDYQNCYVEGGMKKITIDKKTVFIRMV
jgi:hypothetical protein